MEFNFEWSDQRKPSEAKPLPPVVREMLCIRQYDVDRWYVYTEDRNRYFLPDGTFSRTAQFFKTAALAEQTCRNHGFASTVL